MPLLRAEIRGQISGGQVSFTKTYTEGANHRVSYEGQLCAGGSLLVGSWSVGASSGPFVVRLDRPAGELPLIVSGRRRRLGGPWSGWLLFTDSQLPLRTTLREAGEALGGSLSWGSEEGHLKGQACGREVRFESGQGGARVNCTGWLGPRGGVLGGGWTQGLLRGHWLVIRDDAIRGRSASA